MHFKFLLFLGLVFLLFAPAAAAMKNSCPKKITIHFDDGCEKQYGPPGGDASSFSTRARECDHNCVAQCLPPCNGAPSCIDTCLTKCGC